MNKQFKAYYNIIRPNNLAVIVLIQFLFCLKASGFKWSNFIFPDFIFILLSILLVTAAGYIVNDLFDIEIDKINKPNKQYIPDPIGFKQSKVFYFTLVILSLILAINVGFPFFCLLLCVNFLLYYYSQDLKKSILFGNLLISLLAGIVVYTSSYACFLDTNSNAFIAEYGTMAFFVTLCREIVKDIEDMEGDKAQNAKTLVIVYGKKVAKTVAIISLILTLVVLSFILYINPTLLFRIASLGLFIFAFYIIYTLIKANEKKDFALVSLKLKWYFIIGILSVLVA